METINIAIVDDEPLIVDLLRGYLEREPNFRVLDTCNTGAQALQAARKHRLDVMLVDLRMPEIDGISLAKILQK